MIAEEQRQRMVWAHNRVPKDSGPVQSTGWARCGRARRVRIDTVAHASRSPGLPSACSDIDVVVIIFL